MTCNKFGCNYPGEVRKPERTLGKLVDSNFSAIFIGAQGNGPQSLLSLSLLRFPYKQLQQGLSVPCRMEMVLLLCPCPFPGPLCALTLSPPFIPQIRGVAALTSNLLWKIFPPPGEGIGRGCPPGVSLQVSSLRPLGQRAAGDKPGLSNRGRARWVRGDRENQRKNQQKKTVSQPITVSHGNGVREHSGDSAL